VRDFGVEFEMIGISRAAVRNAVVAVTYVNERGERVNERAVVESYGHVSSTTNWRVVTDASVADGCELVSPIMQGGASFELSVARCVAVAEAVRAAGARIDRRCGLHVHVNARDLSGRAMAMLISRFSRFESDFDAVMPESRRGSNNQYCSSVRDAIRVYDRGALVNTAIELGENVSRVANMFYTRYIKLNTTAYSRHGTVEFRQHNGTVDGTKVENWIRFVVAFVNESVARAAYIESAQRATAAAAAPVAAAPVAVAAAPVRARRRSGIRNGQPTKLQIMTDALLSTATGITVEYMQALTGWSHAAVRRGLSLISQHGYEIHRQRVAPGQTIYWASRRDDTAAAAPVPPVPPVPVPVPTPGEDSFFAGVPENVRRFYVARATHFATRAATRTAA
jgi:hypothetical protein